MGSIGPLGSMLWLFLQTVAVRTTQFVSKKVVGGIGGRKCTFSGNLTIFPTALCSFPSEGREATSVGTGADGWGATEEVAFATALPFTADPVGVANKCAQALSSFPPRQTILISCSRDPGSHPRISQLAAGVISAMAVSAPHCGSRYKLVIYG